LSENTLSFQIGEKEVLWSSRVSPDLYSVERMHIALQHSYPMWLSQVPAVHFLVSQAYHFIPILVDNETPEKVSLTILDAVDLSSLNLQMDPRVVPARVRSWSYAAVPDPHWDTIFLLCVIDMLCREELETGSYVLWNTFQVSIEVDQPSHLVVITKIVGPPMVFDEDVVF
jgi:hypothetical protein